MYIIINDVELRAFCHHTLRSSNTSMFSSFNYQVLAVLRYLMWRLFCITIVFLFFWKGFRALIFCFIKPELFLRKYKHRKPVSILCMPSLQKTNKKETCFSYSLIKVSWILPTDQSEFSIGKKWSTVINTK